jgi:tetratricopeptide (TPR) repeat protein
VSAGAALADLFTSAERAYAGGDLDGTLDALERAHLAAIEAGDVLGAATAATRLAMHLLLDSGLMAPVRAWLSRAERLLADEGETPIHAWLAQARADERFLSGDFEASRRYADEAIAVGERHAQPAPVAMARTAAARCLIVAGDLEGGFALLDEAAASLLTGELDDLMAGCVYCEIICVWQSVGRHDLAEEWTDAMSRFAHRQGVGSIGGRCRIHRAELLRLHGHLRAAEDEAAAACEELRPFMRREFGWPLTELGRIRLARGNLVGAERMFLEAHAVGWEPQPGLALLRLAQGDPSGALRSISGALEHPMSIPSKELPPNYELRRAPLLDAKVEIAIAAGAAGDAEQACDELEAIVSRFGGPALEGVASAARGRVLLAAGDAARARDAFGRSAERWNELSAPIEAARARAALADALDVLGETDAATFERDAAQTLLEPLDAVRPDGAVFRCDGDFWMITFDARSISLRDMKGLHLLARLLKEPGREFHVMDLTSTEPAGARSLGDAGPMLDERAVASYKRRLVEIEEDIEEARTFGDDARVALAEADREFLMRELSRAVGMGERERRSGSASERARVSATRALRTAIQRITEHHQTLGEHLERTIRTGTYCSYMPDPIATPVWKS